MLFAKAYFIAYGSERVKVAQLSTITEYTYSKISMAQTSLGPRKLNQGMGNFSH